MGPGNGDQIPGGGGGAQRLRAAGYGNSQFPGASNFWVVLRHRRCHYHVPRADDVIRAVPRRDLDSKRLEVVRHPGVGVTSRYDDASSGEELGQRSHARTGDPHEVDRAGIGVIDQRQFRGGSRWVEPDQSSSILVEVDEPKYMTRNVCRCGWSSSF